MNSRLLVPIVALTLLAAACGSSDDSDSAAGNLASSTTSTTSTTVTIGAASATVPADTADPVTETTDTTATTTATTTTSTAPEPPPTTEAPSSADCLLGTWSLRSEEFVDAIFEAAGAEAQGATDASHYGGEYLITFAPDGSYLGQRLDWALRFETAQGAIVTTITSEDPGTYSVDGQSISVSDAASEATVRLQLDVGGTLQDLPMGGTQTVGTEALSGAGTYTCADDVLTVNVVDGSFPGGIEATWDRVS